MKTRRDRVTDWQATPPAGLGPFWVLDALAVGKRLGL
jgi:hypothetical protein